MSKFNDLFFKTDSASEPRVLPEITLVLAKNYWKAFTAPSPDITATIQNANGEIVGHAAYAVSPLQDRIYFFQIEISPAFRRKGYGLAVLTHLANTYHLPITTIKETFAASSFWATVKKELASSVTMTQTLSISEMDDEKSRWSHLQPEIERLNATISARHLRGEAYADAVGRGLNE